MADKPLWRKAFDAVESRAAGPVEAGAHSDLFGDLLTLNVRLARRTQREVERRTRRLLHMANLPTATDVRRLSEQVASLQRELRELQDRRP
jgi:polyhydroxyalkanoate synthesis regulator phasin